MSTPSAPTRAAGSRSDAGFYLASGLLVLAAGSLVLLWSAIAVTALASGEQVPGLFEVVTAAASRPGDPVAGLGGDVGSQAGPYVVLGVEVALSAAVLWRAVRAVSARRARQGAPTNLAGARELEAMQERAAVATARKISGEAGRQMSDAELIVPLGYVGSTKIYLQHELSVLLFAPSRMGKTSSCVAGWTLDAPGPVISTSTKNDVVARTILARQRLGSVHVHDMHDATGWPEKVLWDVVAGCQDPTEAIARATAMAAGAPSGGTQHGDWFNKLAARVLSYLLHAAALKAGGNIADVRRWGADLEDPEPVNLLRQLGGGHVGRDGAAFDTRDWGDLLRAQAHHNGSDQTVGSMQITLLGILEPLDDPDVLAACCPRPGAVVFDVERFLSSRSALYIVSKATRTSTAPLVTAFVDWVLRNAEKASEHAHGGRLWPPLTLVGDEIANIAPLPNIDTLVSDSGGRGISVRLIAQTKAQLVKRWGRENAEAIFAGVNATIALPGIREPDVLRDLSFLTGQHRVARVSVTSSDERSSSTTSGELTNRMSEDQIRTMELGTALLVSGNMPAAHLHLTPWWDRPDADQLRADEAKVARITGRAMEE